MFLLTPQNQDCYAVLMEKKLKNLEAFMSTLTKRIKTVTQQQFFVTAKE